MTLVEQVQKKKAEFGWSWIRAEHRLEPTPALFREVEKILECDLDVGYREFVTVVGGGAFDGKVNVFGDEPHPWRALMAETFFGFYDDNSYDIRHKANGYKYQLPPFFVPLVIDPAANIAAYVAAGEHKGKIYFQDKEHRDFAAQHKITELYDELEARGMETRRMDIAQAILAWEKLHAAELSKPPGFGNLYLITNSLADFVDRMKRFERPS